MATPDDTGETVHPHMLRVLLVDDNKDQADSLAQLLTGWGHEVRVAYDGLTALEAAQAYQPNVAMIDLGLPGIDGYQLALRLLAVGVHGHRRQIVGRLGGQRHVPVLGARAGGLGGTAEQFSGGVMHQRLDIMVWVVAVAGCAARGKR